MIIFGLIEMLASVQEHVTHNVHFYYIGYNMQYKLILLLAFSIKTEISLEKIKQAKYFLVILDYSPDISHQNKCF